MDAQSADSQGRSQRPVRTARAMRSLRSRTATVRPTVEADRSAETAASMVKLRRGVGRVEGGEARQHRCPARGEADRGSTRCRVRMRGNGRPHYARCAIQPPTARPSRRSLATPDSASSSPAPHRTCRRPLTRRGQWWAMPHGKHGNHGSGGNEVSATYRPVKRVKCPNPSLSARVLSDHR